jgi:hypothetical protein
MTSHQTDFTITKTTTSPAYQVTFPNGKSYTFRGVRDGSQSPREEEAGILQLARELWANGEVFQSVLE